MMKSKTEPVSNNSNAKLRIYVTSAGTVFSALHLLSSLADSYLSIVSFQDFIKSFRSSDIMGPTELKLYAEELKRKLPDWSLQVVDGGYGYQVRGIPSGSGVLRISQIRVGSPGFWEFLGKLSPLTFIRDMINDYHERKKDNLYRSREEERKLQLENQARELDNLKLSLINESIQKELLYRDIAFLKKVGMPQEEIQLYIKEHFERPSKNLLSVLDSGLVSGADVEQLKEE